MAPCPLAAQCRSTGEPEGQPGWPDQRRRRADTPPRKPEAGPCVPAAGEGQTGKARRVAPVALTIHACALPAVAALNEPAPTVSHDISVVAGPRPRAVRRGPFAKGGRVSGARPWVLPPTPCHGDRRQRCTPPREAGHRPIPAIWRTRGSPLARKPPHPRRPLCRPIGGCPTHQPANPPEVRFRTDEWGMLNLFGLRSQYSRVTAYTDSILIAHHLKESPVNRDDS